MGIQSESLGAVFTVASSVPPAAVSFSPRAFAAAAAAEPAAFALEVECAAVGARLAQESKDARQAPFAAAARPDDYSVRVDSAAVDSVPEDCAAAPPVDDHCVGAAPPDDCWAARTVDDRSVLAAPPHDCSVPLDWAAADSVPEGSAQDDCLVGPWADDRCAPVALPDDCWAAPTGDDRSVLAAPPYDWSVPLDWAAADSVPEESVLDDCLVATWADDQCAPAALPDDCSVAAGLDDSAPPDYSADSLQADY